MSSQVTDTGFQASPPTSTPTMVRSRPKLPTIFGGQGGNDGVEDLVGVISTLGSTDFVGKYSTKRRKRATTGANSTATSTSGGASSPSQRANASLSMSPMSPALSPSRTKSPPPDGKATITLTRMRSIKLKLEEVKERQDRAAEMNNSGNIPRRKTGTVEPPCLGEGGVCLLQDPTRNSGDSMQQSASTPTLDTTDPDRSDKPLSTSSPSVILSATADSQEKASAFQSQPEKEKNCLPNRDDIHLSGSITQNTDSSDLVTKTSTDMPHQHRISDSSKSNVESSTERDSDSSLHVTEDDGSIARRKALTERASYYAKDLRDNGGESSNDMEDEGIGAMDIDEETSIDPKLLAKLPQPRNMAVGEHDKGQEDSMDVDTLQGKTLQILSTTSQTEEISSKFNSDQSATKRGTGNGRFLTHPPSKDKPLVGNEGGSVDSNGFGSLRTNKEPVETNDLTSQVSELSIDSHLCPSDTSETPTYRDVIIDVTSKPTDADKFERKNNKSFKYKSKSDPSGEKQKTLEGVDLPIIIGAHAQSVPTLQKEERNEEQQTQKPQESQPPQTKSKFSNLLSKPPKSPHPHISRLKESQLTRSTSEESSEEGILPTQKHVKARRALKKRRVGAVELPKHGASDRDSSRDEAEDSPSPGVKHDHSSTVPSTPTFSPESTLDRIKAKTSLTLPMAKKPNISRSHSSAVDYSTSRPSQKHDGLIYKQGLSPNLGARPKSSDKIKARKGRPAIPEPLAVSSHKSFTWAGSGSTPDLARGRGDRFTYSPRLDTIFSGSSLSLFEGAAEDKEKRDLIVEELVSTEQQYVETLHMLVEKYMIPMKTQSAFDSGLVDDIFYKINEIYMHHATFLVFLESTLKDWDSTTCIGDIIYNNFSKESVIESYVSFIEHFPRAEKVLQDISSKSSFQRYLEQTERETGNKLPLKAHLVKPAQRIPRYELLLKRLLENTPTDHPDHEFLIKANGAIHKLALKINSVKESKQSEDLQDTLKKLELLLITDLVVPDRIYLRHDNVVIMSRKDQCCIWLFSDLAVFTCIKRKSGSVNLRKTSLLLQSPSGQDFVENTKHKVWLKIPLEDLEIVKSSSSLTRKSRLVDREQLEEDFQTLGQISELSQKLKCSHQVILDETVRELMSTVNRQISEHQLKSPPPDANKVDLVVTTQSGLTNLTVVFPTPEKKTSWEAAIQESKQKLATLSSSRPPEFLQALPITKTRAGMQFSCAAPIDGLNGKSHRDVWVCNSDGYVGHMCLLSLQPEPIVTLNTPVPGCNSRILCICAVSSFQTIKRKGSWRKTGSHKTPQITIDKSPSQEEVEDGYVSDSSSTVTEDDLDTDENVLHPAEEQESSRSPSPSRKTSDEKDSSSSSSRRVSESTPPGPTSSPGTRVSDVTSPGQTTPTRKVSDVTCPPSPAGKESAVLDPSRSTMWLGTEDGCIHIFPTTDNIKTTKVKLKAQQSAGVLCVVHMDQKVFVSLANGELVVYRRDYDKDGMWDLEHLEILCMGSATTPVNRMIAVAGKLWCSCQNEIMVLNPNNLDVETIFIGNFESKKSIQCMTFSGLGVWVSCQGSSKINLFHATTYEHLLEISIAQAVAHKLQTADDIIRQHKTACLRITCLLACKDLLWVGTSAGVILTLPIEKVHQSTTKNDLQSPNVTGLVHGHTGHVRFLSAVEVPNQSRRGSNQRDRGSGIREAIRSRRTSGSVATLTMATKMLVISGGDGYENFHATVPSDNIGRDDSTNHLLLWQV